MRTSIALLLLVGCADAPFVVESSANGIWDGQHATIRASFLESDGWAVRDHHLDPDQRVVATIRGQQLEMTKQNHEGPHLVLPSHYYEVIVAIADDPKDELIAVDITNGGPSMAFSFPPGFAIDPLPTGPITLPETVRWTPRAPETMQWWLTGPCINDGYGGYGPVEVLRGDDDVTLVDEGALELPYLYRDAPETCELTLTIDRYRHSGQTRAASRRTVTFTATLD